MTDTLLEMARQIRETKMAPLLKEIQKLASVKRVHTVPETDHWNKLNEEWDNLLACVRALEAHAARYQH